MRRLLLALALVATCIVGVSAGTVEAKMSNCTVSIQRGTGTYGHWERATGKCSTGPGYMYVEAYCGSRFGSGMIYSDMTWSVNTWVSTPVCWGTLPAGANWVAG